VIQVTTEEQKRLSSGDIRTLKVVLEKQLEKVKEDLLYYRPDKLDYDCVLKGKGLLLKELLELLKDC
jgi:hypothetical protein